jgi:NAD(P)-dependent dehydrogenase (short-subunit alcohol dehydrogenase family)
VRRVVVVTGATRGVGRGIADAFARRGDTLVVVGRSTAAQPNPLGLPGTLESVADELRAMGGDVLAINADLAKPDGVERVATQVLATYGAPDVLVNNAAATFIGPFLEIQLSRWRTALNLNLLAPVALIQAFLPGMLERDRGHVINVTSAAARTLEFPDSPIPQLSYAASKAALDSFTYGLLPELRDTGVAVNLVAPVVLTESADHHMSDPMFDDFKKTMAAMGPFGEAVARIADQPPGFRGHYLDNERLEELGFLIRG